MTDMRQSCHAFMDIFCAMYQKTIVTPCMHHMVQQCNELVSIHGCALAMFNQQNVEKANDVVKSVYLMCNNLTDGPLQVIQRAKRVLSAKIDHDVCDVFVPIYGLSRA